MKRFIIPAVLALALAVLLSQAGGLTQIENIFIENTTTRAAHLRLSSPSRILKIENTAAFAGNLVVGARMGIGTVGTVEGLEVLGKVKFVNANSYIYGEDRIRFGTPSNVLLSISLEGVEIPNLRVSGWLMASEPGERGTMSNYVVAKSGESYWAKIGPLLIQWGRQRTGRSGEGGYYIAFPRQFYSEPRVVVTADTTSYLSLTSFDYWLQVQSVTRDGFIVYEQYDGDSTPPSDAWNVFINWIAVGVG
jgi:hypothetical protein